MKKAIIYHKSDLDGIGSAAIVLQKYPDAELFPADYGDEPYEVEDFRGKDVFIVDFCPEEIEKIYEVCGWLRWIDHHKSSMEKHKDMWEEEKLDGSRNIKHSAIYLTYKYCYRLMKKVPLAVKYIEDYDMWWFKQEGTKEFCEYASLQLRTPEDVDWRCLLDDEDITPVVVESYRQNGELLIEAKQVRIDKTTKHIIARQWGKHKVGIVNTNHDLSNVGNAIATSGYDIGVVWRHVDGKIIVGLRSTEVDVSVIARMYGGGGHKLAAGCTIDFHTLLNWLA